MVTTFRPSDPPPYKVLHLVKSDLDHAEPSSLNIPHQSSEIRLVIFEYRESLTDSPNCNGQNCRVIFVDQTCTHCLTKQGADIKAPAKFFESATS